MIAPIFHSPLRASAEQGQAMLELFKHHALKTIHELIREYAK